MCIFILSPGIHLKMYSLIAHCYKDSTKEGRKGYFRDAGLADFLFREA